MCHAKADVVGGYYTHLKGSNNQWCAKYFIEYPSTQSASSFLTPAMKYTMKICQRQCTFINFIYVDNVLQHRDVSDVSNLDTSADLSSQQSVVPQRYMGIPLPGVSESI